MSHTPFGSRALFTAGMVAVLMATGGSVVATAQPATTPATPTTSDTADAQRQQQVSADPCAPSATPTPTTTAVAPTSTTPTPLPCTTVPSVPTSSAATTTTAVPAPSVASATPAPAPAPSSVASAPQQSAEQGVSAPVPAEPAADQPVAPTDPNLSSKTAEPDPDYAPTENPNATVVPGEMRSDREEIPAPFTKADADKAETMEARQGLSRAAVGCQTFWPSPYEVCGVILDKYNSLGGPGSFLSFPNSPEYTNPDGFGKRTQFLFTELRHAF